MLQQNPQRMTFTQYWHSFRQKLFLLHEELTANAFDDKLPTVIKSLFPEDSESLQQSFHKALITHPEEVKPSDSKPRSMSRAKPPDYDELYLRYYVLSMRLAMEGAQLESLPLFTPFSDKPSQNSLAAKLMSYRSRMSEDGLPVVNSEATHRFSKLFYFYAKHLVIGTVYSDSNIIQSSLDKHRDKMNLKLIELSKRQQFFVNSHQSAFDIHRKIGSSLVGDCAWLQEFQRGFLDLVDALVLITAQKHPEPVVPPPPASYLSWVRWPNWPTWMTFSRAKGAASSVVASSPVYESLPNPHIDELKLRLAQCESRIGQLERVQTNLARVSVQALGSLEAETQVSVTAEKLEVLYLCNELKTIIRTLSDCHTRTLQVMEQSTSHDHFTYSYFRLVDETYQHLLKLLHKEQPPLQEAQAMVVFRLVELSKCVAHPDVYRRKWFVAFSKDFCEPDAVLHYFKKTTGQQSIKSFTQPEKHDDAVLAKKFSDMKL